MHSDFFREDKEPRPYNPTFLSNQIFQTMGYPFDQHAKQMQKKRLMLQNIQRNESNSLALPSNPQQPKDQLKKGQRDKAKSNLANYGSHSLKSIKKSSHDIFVSQQRKYDIVNGRQKKSKYRQPVNPYWWKPKENIHVAKKITQISINKVKHRLQLK